MRLFIFLQILLLVLSCQSGHERQDLLIITPSNTSLDTNDLQSRLSSRFNTIKLADLEYLLEDTLRNYTNLVLVDCSLEELAPSQINALERYLQAGGNGIGFNLKSAKQSKYKSPLLHGLFSREQPSLKNTNNGFYLSSIGSGTFLSFREAAQKATNFNEAIVKAIDQLPKGTTALSYEAVATEYLPPEYWFEIDTLVMSLHEPMEFEILQNGDVLFIERGGALKCFKANQEVVKNIGKLSTIITESNGLNGLAKSLDYSSTGHIYLSYLPAIEKHNHRISRFTILEDSLDLNSEKVLLQIPIDHTNGWHGTNAFRV